MLKSEKYYEGMLNSCAVLVQAVRDFCPSMSNDPESKKLAKVLHDFDVALEMFALFDSMHNWLKGSKK